MATPFAYNQMLQDHVLALEQTPRKTVPGAPPAYEAPPYAVPRQAAPAYADAMKGRSPVTVSEKPLANEQKPKKMSTLRSILTGDVHKQNPRYVLEASLADQPSSTRQSTSQPKPKREGSSTLRSILTGDVQKHNPRYVLEESVTGRPSAARDTSKSHSTQKPKETNYQDARLMETLSKGGEGFMRFN